MVKRLGLGKRKRITAQADYYESQAEDIEGELPTQEPTQQSDEPARKKQLVRLTDEQIEAMADWLKDKTVLYNKGKKEYLYVNKQDVLWAAQAQVMGISGEFC